MIAVMGATGPTGRLVAEGLLARGERVRAIGRDAAKLQPLVDRGAEAAIGDVLDADFLARAFDGVEAAYTLIPPNVITEDARGFQDRAGQATVDGLRRAGVKKVVLLSSQGAHLPSGTGPIAGLHAQEDRLRSLGVDVLFLRAAYFFENLYANLPVIRHQGVNGGAIAPDAPLDMIATRDIAAAAVEALARRDFGGVVVRDLLGPRVETMARVTSVLGEKIGRPGLAYVQFPYDGFAAALVEAGLSKDVARLYAEMSQAINEGRLGLPERTPENTTPTRFEEFADELAAAYARD